MAEIVGKLVFVPAGEGGISGGAVGAGGLSEGLAKSKGGLGKLLGKGGFLGIALNQTVELLGKIKNIMESVSPAFKATMDLFKASFMLIMRPIADFFANLFRPMAIMLIRFLLRVKQEGLLGALAGTIQESIELLLEDPSEFLSNVFDILAPLATLFIAFKIVAGTLTALASSVLTAIAGATSGGLVAGMGASKVLAGAGAFALSLGTLIQLAVVGGLLAALAVVTIRGAAGAALAGFGITDPKAHREGSKEFNRQMAEQGFTPEGGDFFGQKGTKMFEFTGSLENLLGTINEDAIPTIDNLGALIGSSEESKSLVSQFQGFDVQQDTTRQELGKTLDSINSLDKTVTTTHIIKTIYESEGSPTTGGGTSGGVGF